MSDGERSEPVVDVGDRHEATRLAEAREPILLQVEYKRLNTFFYDYTKNISQGGTFIKTDRPLAVGTLFLFRLKVPVAAEPLELKGEVRWVVRPGEPRPAGAPPGQGGKSGQEGGMGIRFAYADPEERARLERAVEAMMVKSLGQLIYSRLIAARDRAAVVQATAQTSGQTAVQTSVDPEVSR